MRGVGFGVHFGAYTRSIFCIVSGLFQGLRFRVHLLWISNTTPLPPNYMRPLMGNMYHGCSGGSKPSALNPIH